MPAHVILCFLTLTFCALRPVAAEQSIASDGLLLAGCSHSTTIHRLQDLRDGEDAIRDLEGCSSTSGSRPDAFLECVSINS